MTSTSVTYLMRSKISQTTTTKIMPRMAKVRVVRAAAAAFGSPPDIRNWNPPQMSMIKKAIAAKGARSVIILLIMMVMSLSLAGSSKGVGRSRHPVKSRLEINIKKRLIIFPINLTLLCFWRICRVRLGGLA